MRALIFLFRHLILIFNSTAQDTSAILAMNSTRAFVDITDPCQSISLSPMLWKQLDINNYLKEYPSGDHLSLPAFACQVGACNFECGIGSFCDPSDLCAPVEGKAWYALIAAKRWNVVNNQLYSAIPLALSVIADITPSMVMDLIPDASAFWTQSACLTDLAVAAVSAIPGAVFGTESLEVTWTIMTSVLMIDAGWSWAESNVLVSDPPRYEIWEDIVFSLDKFQKHMQETLSNFTQSVIHSGVSTKDGLSGINMDGSLFLEKMSNSEEAIRKGLTNDLKLRSLTLIFKFQHAFIVRGAAPCIQDGPGGSLDGDDVFSICDKENVMMTIVIPKNDQKVETKIYNAQLMESKYGIVGEEIISAAWDCQKKYGTYEPDFSFNITDKRSQTHTECVFNMPICDLTIPGIHDIWVKTGSVARACKQLGRPA